MMTEYEGWLKQDYIEIKAANSQKPQPSQPILEFLIEFDRKYYRWDKPEYRLSVFHDIPNFISGEAVLYDPIADSNQLSDDGKALIFSMGIEFPDGLPKHKHGDSKISIKIFVEDMQSPKFSIKMIELVRGSFEQSLYIRVEVDQRMKIALVDPYGAWVMNTPKLEVYLSLR